MKRAASFALFSLLAACEDKNARPSRDMEGVEGAPAKPTPSEAASTPASATAPSSADVAVAPSISGVPSNMFNDRIGEPPTYNGLDWGDGSPRRPLVPRIRMGATSVNGKLPPEVIQRIVRRNFGRFRLCYEEALKLDDTLEGKITVSYVIRSDASVATVKAESDLKDKTFVECVRKSFESLEYPSPESGLVSVRYPLMFSAPGFAFTIHGKHSDKVQVEDVKQALTDAGYTIVKAGPKPGFPEATLFSLKKDALELKLTFDPYDSLEGGSSGEQVGPRKSTPEYERLAKDGVLLIEGRLVLAAECSERAAAKALLDAIAKPTNSK